MAKPKHYVCNHSPLNDGDEWFTLENGKLPAHVKNAHDAGAKVTTCESCSTSVWPERKAEYATRRANVEGGVDILAGKKPR
jgi:hypothetical protein